MTLIAFARWTSSDPRCVVALIFRLVTPVLVGAVAAMSFCAALSGQPAARTGAPVAGTWGGEASVGTGQGASLLLFQSPRWALLAGGTIQSTTSTFVGGDVAGTNRFTLTALRVGARRYGRSGLGIRPIAGLGLLVAGATGDGTQVGGYGELGAAYFFNPHVSLGASAELNILARDGGGTSFGATLARLTGAVYF